jgi:hypothetical protein
VPINLTQTRIAASSGRGAQVIEPFDDVEFASQKVSRQSVWRFTVRREHCVDTFHAQGSSRDRGVVAEDSLQPAGQATPAKTEDALVSTK